MQYSLMLYQTDAQFAARTDRTRREAANCVIEVPDHETALAWARRAPFEHCGAVEVRPTRIVS